MRRLLIAAPFVLSTIVILTPDAQAQTAYPTRSIRFIVPVTTGGPSDIVARLLSDKLAASLGKPVIVNNRPGASNTVGAAIVAKAEPDGHTLLMAAANMATIQVLMRTCRSIRSRISRRYR
jgi:tripartite-type tricarboxylate transporter receptor subunit TctC